MDNIFLDCLQLVVDASDAADEMPNCRWSKLIFQLSVLYRVLGVQLRISIIKTDGILHTPSIERHTLSTARGQVTDNSHETAHTTRKQSENQSRLHPVKNKKRRDKRCYPCTEGVRGKTPNVSCKHFTGREQCGEIVWTSSMEDTIDLLHHITMIFIRRYLNRLKHKRKQTDATKLQ